MKFKGVTLDDVFKVFYNKERTRVVGFSVGERVLSDAEIQGLQVRVVEAVEVRPERQVPVRSAFAALQEVRLDRVPVEASKGEVQRHEAADCR